MRRHSAAWALTTSALLLLARDGRSDATSPTVRLSWVRGKEATGCPDAQTIVDRVRARLGRDPFSERATTAAEVFVAHGEEGFVAEMRMRGAGGAVEGERTLQSRESCDTLASAVALALALFVDPNAALAPPPPAPAPVPPPAPVPVVAPAPAPVPPSPPPSVPAAPPETTPPQPRGPGKASPVSLAVSAGARVGPGLLPGAGWASLLRADVEIVKRLSLGAEAIWAPEERTGDGRFAFGVSALGASGCFDVVSRAWLRVAPCLGAWTGEIHAVVFDTTLLALPPGGRIWGAVEAAARLRLRVAGPLFTEARLAALAPLARYGFSVVGQSSAVFQEPPVVPVADLGLGVSIP